MHTRDVLKIQNKINSVGCTEKYKYDFSDHSRRLQVIFDAHPRNSLALNLKKRFF